MIKSENRTAVVWFRRDLRLHDNEALTDALQLCDNIIPVFIFDQREWEGTTPHGFPKVGPFRKKFIIESVVELRENLQQLGSELIVRVGQPEKEVFDIARETRSVWVFCNRERTREEVQVQNALESQLWTIGTELRYYRGKMLYYTSDLPFPVPHTPDVFSQFRKEVEQVVLVRNPIDPPKSIPTRTRGLLPGDIPALEAEAAEIAKSGGRKLGYHNPGGEMSGLQRLKEYIWETESVAQYKETRDDLMGMNFSSKFSPYLAVGCLSPKLIYHEVEKFEEKVVENKSTYWLKFELIWRDFFRFIAKKYGDKIFLKGGIKGETPRDQSDDFPLFERWYSGMTGIPLIDANMRQLTQTGYMSNRGRQNVASFLVNDYKVNWQLGAEYFESYLIDYDPASNYGNWNYMAGVGTDPVENRYFNILSQAHRHDQHGEYVKKWIPELAEVPSESIHEIYKEKVRKPLESQISLDYPAPVFEPDW